MSAELSSCLRLLTSLSPLFCSVIPFIGFFTVTLYSGAMMIYERRMPKQNLEAADTLAYAGSKEEVEEEKLEAPTHRF